ncbi:hypothetical protein J4474_04225 [Candidatus Pacearchaeota archaeon]|nr:hypothetical protein [Candidatus Pacearchaeota archaeon]
MHHQGRGWKILGIIVLIIVVLIAIYFTFFFNTPCKDMACYIGHQEKCSKTVFTNDGKEAIWKYTITGKENEKCVVDVKLLSLKEGGRDKEVLEGKSMQCYLKLGSSINPESDLSQCHGLLKEEFQNAIIQRLHEYIYGNVGQISTELEKVI